MGIRSFFKKEVMELSVPIKTVQSRFVYVNGLWFQNLLITLKSDVFNVDCGYYGQKETTRPLIENELLIFPSSAHVTGSTIHELNTYLLSGKPLFVVCGDSKDGKESFLDDLQEFIPGLSFEYFVHESRGWAKQFNNTAFKKYAERRGEYKFSFEKIPSKGKIYVTSQANEPIAWSYKNIYFIFGNSFSSISKTDNYYQRDNTREVKKRVVAYVGDIIDLYLSLNIAERIDVPSWFAKFFILDEGEKIRTRDFLNSELQKFEELKELFILDGKSLENLLKKKLVELGFSLSLIGDEDAVIDGDVPLILEIKGTKNNLKKTMAYQLLTHIAEAKERVSGNLKPLLFINYELNKSPEKRLSLDRKNLLLCKNEGVAVLTPAVFIKHYSLIIAGEESLDDFRALLLKTNGLVV